MKLPPLALMTVTASTLALTACDSTAPEPVASPGPTLRALYGIKGASRALSLSRASTRAARRSSLRSRGIDTLVVAGIMAHLAVAMTAQDGAILGYRVLVASDATATRDLPGASDSEPVDHRALKRAALAAIADQFADVVPTAAIVALPLAQ